MMVAEYELHSVSTARRNKETKAEAKDSNSVNVVTHSRWKGCWHEECYSPSTDPSMNHNRLSRQPAGPPISKRPGVTKIPRPRHAEELCFKC